MTTLLYVHHEGATVGTLRAWAFAYAPSWLERPDAWAISSSLPLVDRPHEAAARNWFTNLLPEAGARERIARRLRIDPEDDFALLRALGGECAGALTIDEEPEVAPPEAWSTYRPISEAEIADLASVPGTIAGLVGSGDVRLSLAGAQDKLPIRLTDDGQPSVPLQRAASTHILKLGSRDHAALVENEALCLRLAHRVGLPTVEAQVRRSGDALVLIVRRYDRLPPATAATRRPRARRGTVVLPSVSRLHQEDFAQALGYSRRQKYETEGGPSLGACAELLRRNGERPAIDLRELVRWLAFCAVVGNRDNHAKNLARVLDPATGRWRLAPFYDLVNTTSYRGLSKSFAFRIGGQASPTRVSASTWERQATELAVSPRLLLREVAAMTDRIEAALPAAIADVTEGLGREDRLVQFARAIAKGLRWTRRSLTGR